MTVGVFDLFKIGIGPSSSHTVGPMRAARLFAEDLLADSGIAPRVDDVVVHLYGSLAATGKGHGTFGAVLLGLEGNDPKTIDPEAGQARIQAIDADGGLRLLGRIPVSVCTERLVQHPLTILPQHPNGMRFVALDPHGTEIYARTMFSVGGGFVADEHEADKSVADVIADDHGGPSEPSEIGAFASGDELLRICDETGLAISDVLLRHEKRSAAEDEIRAGVLEIAAAMRECIENGKSTHGVLPGGLEVARRAPTWYEALNSEDPDHAPEFAMDRVSLCALAVNEENAAGGRVVTAPTNGAAGIIPAVLYYALTYLEHHDPDDAAVRFLLTAAAVGSLYKENASISGAEVGCQGEVGSACSMAAAGLCELMGGKPDQVENAAEIAMEHNLGLTCDPIGGLVQIPCIERNAMAAVKAITAARFALRGTGEHHVSLDQVIETMRQTGADMNSRYKETAMGGLAVNVVEC